QRFGLDRRALAAILTIDAGGIGRMDRDRAGRDVTAIAVAPPRPPLNPRDLPIAKSAPPPSARANETVTVTAQAPVIETQAAASASNVAPAEPADALVPAFEIAQDRDGRADVEEGVAGGVEGGVVGGVAGGVIGFSAGGADTGTARIIRTETDDAPLRVGGERQRRESERKTQTIDWTKRILPPKSRIKELESQLDANPKDRELYNQLGELLAAYSEWSSLRRLTLRWQPYDPENPQVYELLGMADEHLGNDTEAARAYASLIEIGPAKTELLQRAGLLLLGIHRARLAEAPLRKALEARPDRVNGYRHLALMLWSEGRHEEAARVLESATTKQFPNWYLDVQRVVREELGYVYRGWLAKDPSRRSEITARAREYAVDLDRRDALRVTLA
ncbi:MAG TPA: tetratricopeptide repeat protein, partial [Thermoanaerobaculia bacterium]